MFSDFFDNEVLKKGMQKMIQVFQQIHQEDLKNPDKLVAPKVKPGFLRQQLQNQIPQNGKDIIEIIQQAKDKIHPSYFVWGNKKYFGYFPSTISFTNILADAFGDAFHSPAFNYMVSPGHTQLQNIVMDWTVKGLGLPQKFLLKNSGGATIINSVTQAIFNTIHAAKRKKMQQLGINNTDPRLLKLVAYCSQFCHNASFKSLKNKQIPYIRVVPCKYSQKQKNLVVQINKFKQMIEQDIKQGLIPFWYGGTYGSTFSCSNDLSQELLDICQKHKVWYNLDGAYLTPSWFCSENRPQINLLQRVQSIQVNFGKSMLMPGSTVLLVSDKKQYTSSFGQDTSFTFYKNQYTGQNDVVDYKDWIIGVGRRNNAIRFYFLFKYYGLNKLQEHIRSKIEYCKMIESWLIEREKLFKIFAGPHFGYISFQVKNKKGQVCNSLTKRIAERVRNCESGFITPAQLKQFYIIRIIIGNPNTRKQDVNRFLEQILKVTLEQIEREQL